jgi:YVTN family beta-propeller protein
MIGGTFVAHDDNPGTFVNISVERSQFIIGVVLKTVLMLSTTKSNKAQNALIISVIISFSCLIITPFQLYGQQSASNQFSNNDYVQYENTDHKISLLIPSNWTVTEGNNSINFLSPLEDKSDLFREGLFIKILRSGNIPLNEYVSLDIIALRQGLEHFTLTYSDANFTLSNYPAYKIIYTYINKTTNYDAMRIWAVIGRNTYTISYDAESDKFRSYLPLIEKMIGSLRAQPRENTSEPVQNTAGLRLRNNPYNIAVDAGTNRIYITNLRSDAVSVIDGQKDSILTDIKVGEFPSAIAVNPDSGRLFVANKDSDAVSVIDGSTNAVIANIPVGVGAKPVDIAIDPNEEGINSLIFVSNSDSDTVSVIDGSTNAVIATIKARQEPVDVAVNPITNRLYIANYQNNTVSVIDYYLSKNQGLKNETIANIQVGDGPESIDFNPITNRLYVSNSDSDTVSVIDGSTNAVIANIPVGTNPYGVAVNTDANLIYVANYLSNTVSVIDGSTNRVIDSISVNRFPFAVSYNQANKIAYVTHLSRNIVSMINNTHPVIGVTFEINPANSGYVNCNGKEFLNGDYFRYNINTTIDCLAVPNTGFSFSSWSGDLTSTPIPSSQTTFKVSKFGNVTANFIIPIEFTVPKEYWDQLSIILVSVIIPAIASWSIPAIAGWLNGKRQREHLEEYMARIYQVNNKSNPQDTVEYLRQLEEIRSDSEKALAKGNISESQYQILSNKILEYLKQNK